MKKFFSYLLKILFFLLILIFLGGALFLGREFYLKERATDVMISVEGKDMDKLMLSKGDAIAIQFSQSVLKESVEENFKFDDRLKIKKEWRGRRYFRIEIEEYPEISETHQIVIDDIRTKWYIPLEKQVDFSFSAIAPPEIKKITPGDEQGGVEYDSEIEIEFKEPMGEEYFLEFKSEPKIQFDYSMSEDRSVITVLPLEEFDKNTKYEITLTARHRAFDDFERSVYNGFFVTKRPPEIVYNFDKNGDSLKTEERVEDVKPQILEGRYIDIDISSQSLFIFEDGLEKGAFKVSTGLRGMDTPVGSFKVMGKARRPWSQKYSLYMPWFIQFTNQGHGIHELPEWPGGVKEGTHHLGIPVSHGCVRLGVGPAKVVYDFVEIGTPIVIHQ